MSDTSSVASSVKSTRHVRGHVQSNVPRVANIQPKRVANLTSNSTGVTILPCGERVPKNHKCLIAAGAIEETIGLIGSLKSRYFGIDLNSARKMFVFARLTKIQEDLLDIIKSITTSVSVSSKHTASRFSMDRVRELEEATIALGTQKFIGSPGASQIEADLYLIGAVVRRSERQIINARDPSIGLTVEESVQTYMDKLGEYIMCLIPYVSGRF